uniref:F-box domain-containing protein n=1 Tax=Oryza nivara TaxID=4536 RepID=A0A0E0GEQ2_ORYNI
MTAYKHGSSRWCQKLRENLIDSVHAARSGPSQGTDRGVDESYVISSMEEEAAAATCEIARLPEELLVAALSLTSPRDACRAAAVCRDFRAAADSDAVWSRFLPRDLPRLADGELSPPPPSTKGLFLRLSAAPLLLPHELTVRSPADSWKAQPNPPMCAHFFYTHRVMANWVANQISMWLEREKGGKFKEGAELLSVCWLEIHGKILSKMLSRNTNYAAYLVYRIADRSYGLDFPFQEASVSIGGSTTTRQVGSVERWLKRRCSHALVLAEDIEHPQKRSDGWMELKLGELYNEEGDDGEVCISFRETEGHWKRGLVVQGIEIRPKKTLTSNCLACSHEKPSYSLLTTSRSSKEEIFLTDGLTSMWLDMETGFKCYMLSARALQLANSTDTWRLISLTGASRFSEVIELTACYELVICGKIPCKMLSGNTNYAAYIVFVVVEDSFGLATILDASVSVGGSLCTTRQVCFDSTSSLSADEHFVEDNIEVPQDGSVILPQERDDGWMELEVGEFFHNEECNGDVCFSVLEAEDGRWLSKRGLVVQGIEIRPKKSSCRIVFEREREMERERGRRTMEEAWIDRLPQDLLQRVIPLETPRDACRAAAVSQAFRAVADSDVVWGKFQPDDSSLQLADGELFPPPRSKKERFLRLSAGLLLLPDRRRGMWLDRGTGARCYMLSARALVIIWGDTPRYWRWIPLADSSRFEEGAELIDVCWMEIRCNIDSRILSPNSTYAAFMVFKIAEGFYGLDTPLQEGTVSLGGRESRREVAFTSIDPRPPQGSAAYPQKRADGWMEVELGEFFNEDGEDGEVGISLMSKGPNWKRGLIKPDSSKGAEASPSMEEGEACDDCECEIARLPEELLSAAISLTAPRDAFRAAAVSRAFRAAADSDAVWASFLPRDLPDLADGELSPAPPSKKDLFLRLSAGHYHLLPDRLKIAEEFYQLDTVDATVNLGGSKSSREVALTRSRRRPEEEISAVLFPRTRADGWMEVELGEFFNEEGEDGNVNIRIFGKGPNWKKGLISMWLDREKGAKCYMLSARALQISWGDSPQYWSWIPLADSRFKEGAELLSVFWLEIRGKLPGKKLSQNTNYAAYLVYKIADRSYGLDFPFQEASVSIGGSITARQSMWLDRETGFKCYMLSARALQILSPPPPSNKALFLRLSGSDGNVPLLLPDRLRGIWFDRETGAKCYVLSARTLVIKCSETSDYRRWIPLADSRFAEAVEFMDAPPRMEIRSKIDSMVLTPNSTYAAFMVFKIADGLYELDTSPHDATVSIGENESRREVAFTGRYPERRADGWMEVELGEFFNEDGEDGAVYMRLMSEGPNRMRGLIFYFQPPRTHTHSTTIFSFSVFFSFAIKPDSRTEGSMEEEGEGLCEIARLPEELLSAAISRASPRDACHAAAVSPAFRAAADSDAVWASFLPRDLPDLADGELSPAPASKKELFLRLSDGPYLLSDRLMSMWLDRETGAKCYMLSARSLVIIWGDTPHYWRWIPLTDSRFAEGAELIDVCWLEIHGRIHSKMLSPNSTYAAYMVFKIADEFYGLDAPFQEASVSLGGRGSTKIVCVQSYDSEDEEVPENYWPMSIGPLLRQRARRRDRRLVLDEGVTVPQKRTDEWMELEMGEFINEEGEDGEVCFSLMETKGGNWKRGLIVQGIEIRLKKSG